MLDYELTGDQRAMRDLAREIAEKEIRPVAPQYDLSLIHISEPTRPY